MATASVWHAHRMATITPTFATVREAGHGLVLFDAGIRRPQSRRRLAGRVGRRGRRRTSLSAAGDRAPPSSEWPRRDRGGGRPTRREARGIAGLGGRGGRLRHAGMRALPVGVPSSCSRPRSGDPGPTASRSSDDDVLCSSTSPASTGSPSEFSRTRPRHRGACEAFVPRRHTRSARGATGRGPTPCAPPRASGSRSRYEVLVFHATGRAGSRWRRSPRRVVAGCSTSDDSARGRARRGASRQGPTARGAGRRGIRRSSPGRPRHCQLRPRGACRAVRGAEPIRPHPRSPSCGRTGGCAGSGPIASQARRARARRVVRPLMACR